MSLPDFENVHPHVVHNSWPNCCFYCIDAMISDGTVLPTPDQALVSADTHNSQCFSTNAKGDPMAESNVSNLESPIEDAQSKDIRHQGGAVRLESTNNYDATSIDSCLQGTERAQASWPSLFALDTGSNGTGATMGTDNSDWLLSFLPPSNENPISQSAAASMGGVYAVPWADVNVGQQAWTSESSAAKLDLEPGLSNAMERLTKRMNELEQTLKATQRKMQSLRRQMEGRTLRMQKKGVVYSGRTIRRGRKYRAVVRPHADENQLRAAGILLHMSAQV
ncbi:hypothetical protein K458DRAFT_407149 [Lentithecium fluviatile CBS 122367]|uniref:Uncharacterized protein n=1 Tax=Lentithecium fluviatile CBS 122367 TaxID=1168545 RepID=A0A6G1IS22_9PLEO|nr:hypothetical protein K458DRAFT_407149 [Lentithecium fluviatile CBS 122367]